MRGLILSSLILAAGAAEGKPRIAPDMDAVISLMGRHASGHACPIAEHLALTAAHVVDPRPFDPTVPVSPADWSNGLGRSGALLPVSVARDRDLALMRSEQPFGAFYPISRQAPVAGQAVYALAFDWRKRQDMLAPRVLSLEVLRVVARMIVTTPEYYPGASGGCLLNASGEVLGIVAWGMESDDGREVGLAVGVWGESFEAIP